MVSLYDKSHITIHYKIGIEIKISTENIELAGNLVQSLATFLNLDNLQVKYSSSKQENNFYNICLQTVAHFPNVEVEITELFRKIDGYQATYTNLSLDLSQKKNQEKNLIIRIEDARLYNPQE